MPSKYALELVTKLKALCTQRFGHDDAWPDLFVAYDGDQDGELTGAEVGKMFRDAGIGTVSMGMWVTNTILQLDKDESGTISRPEFEQAIKKMAPENAPPAKAGMSEAQARAIVLQLRADPASVDLTKLSPLDREIVEHVDRLMAYEPLGVQKTVPPIPLPPTPTTPGVRTLSTPGKPKPAKRGGPSFADQIGVGLIVGLVLMVFAGARGRGRR